MVGFGIVKFRFGGSFLCLMVRIVLSKLLIFAVVFRCFILVLSELIV